VKPEPIIDVLLQEIVCHSSEQLEPARKRVWAGVDSVCRAMKSEMVFGFLSSTPQKISTDDAVGPARFGAVIKIVVGNFGWEVRNLGTGLLITPEPGSGGYEMRVLMDVLSCQKTYFAEGGEFLVEIPGDPQVIRILGVRYELTRTKESLLIRNLSEPGGPILAELFAVLANF